MSYVDRYLIPDETVVYRGKLTGLPYWWAALPLVATLAAAVLHNPLKGWIPAGILALVTLATWAWVRVRRAFAEFAVTNKRIMIKMGVIQLRTTEIMLSKVENVAVAQGLSGRIFNYGTITVTGTGGTRETFHDIAAPLEFRRQVQAQLARLEERLAPARSGPNTSQQ